jgi:sec-independent protein translocase protein TatA
MVVFIEARCQMNDLILLSMPGGTELILLFLIVLLLFGARRIPEVAQNIGKGIREFKKSMREVQSEIDSSDQSQTKIEKPKQENKGQLENKNE